MKTACSFFTGAELVKGQGRFKWHHRRGHARK